MRAGSIGLGYTSIAPIHGNGYNCAAYREGSNGHDDGKSPAEAFKEVGNRIGELKEFASYYVGAKLDGIKVTVFYTKLHNRLLRPLLASHRAWILPAACGPFEPRSIEFLPMR